MNADANRRDFWRCNCRPRHLGHLRIPRAFLLKWQPSQSFFREVQKQQQQKSMNVFAAVLCPEARSLQLSPAILRNFISPWLLPFFLLTSPSELCVLFLILHKWKRRVGCSYCCCCCVVVVVAAAAVVVTVVVAAAIVVAVVVVALVVVVIVVVVAAAAAAAAAAAVVAVAVVVVPRPFAWLYPQPVWFGSQAWLCTFGTRPSLRLMGGGSCSHPKQTPVRGGTDEVSPTGTK